MSVDKNAFRIEKDSMGELQVPKDALYGAQTQRAVQNFPISGITMPAAFIQALGRVKKACASANSLLGGLDEEKCAAIVSVCDEIIAGELNQHFPIDVFQTGSGTSTNMNANEVVANRALDTCRIKIHPNDHVNMSQSSNDVIPTALHVSAVMACTQNLLPALSHLRETIDNKARSLSEIVKTGRTHLMDAMPVTMEQELSGWSAQINNGIERIEHQLLDMCHLAIGGTAVGTGINADKAFGSKVCEFLKHDTGVDFKVADNLFERLSSQDASVALSGQLKTVAVSITKIANDLRWMNSGPLAGIGEIALPALQPGSSIMPGKVNPVIPESAAMACAQVLGNDQTITIAGQSGNFQLNVMLPLVAHNLLQSIELLSNTANTLADRAIRDFTVNLDKIDEALARNPILVTALNSVIGYEMGAKIAKQAYAQGRTVIDVASELTDIPAEELQRILSPKALTK